MKLFITTFLMLLSSISFGQNYKSIIAQAETFYTQKEYKNSVENYKEAFKIDNSGSDFYNAACSAALSGEESLAFRWLNLALENGWSNINHLKSDSDLVSLHNHKKWDKLISDMQSVIIKREAQYDKPLQKKLLAILQDDQQIRKEYISAQKQYGRESKQVDSLGKIAMYKDSVNLVKVTEILDKHGWVGADKVGVQANQTLFLVIQHSDLKTQQQYLPMMKEAVQTGNANRSALALLEDRIALGEGKRQIYGSQIGYDNQTNKSYVLPLADPDNVDRRRAEVGLGLLADYVKRWGIVWNVEEYKKDLKKLEDSQ